MAMESHLSRFRLKPSLKNSIVHEPPRDVLANPEPDANPLMGRVTACDRCRRLKKKCSRTIPECGYCAGAGVGCSLGAFTPENVLRLQTRLTWLEDFIDRRNLLGGGRSITQIITGTDLSQLADNEELPSPVSDPPASNRADRTYVPLPSDPNRGVESESPLPRDSDVERASKRPRLDSVDTSLLGNINECGYEVQGLQVEKQDDHAHAHPHVFVDAYFRDVNRAYPFLSRSKVLSTLKNGDYDIPPSQEGDDNSTMLYLVMAIGKTTLQRAGRVPTNDSTRFEVKYSEIVSSCMMRESIDTIQILLLLAIYSLFDPHWVPVSPIVDLAARQAIRLGLTQRAPAGADLSPAEVERNHRLFWSIYVIDRMIAASTGIPPALNIAATNIPLPGLTVDEFSSPDRMDYTSTLQVARHIIHLRQIEDKVFRLVHLRDGTVPNMNTDRIPLITDLRTEIEDWYSNGCLLKSSEPGDVTIHITITWLASRYYNLLLLLYYPSQSNPAPAMLPRTELLSIAQKHMRANAARFEHRQLPLTNVTLCRIFPVCLIFLNCFLYHTPEDGTFNAGEEISLCGEILAAYPDHWIQAHRAAAIISQLAALVTASISYNSTPFSRNPASTLSQADRAWCHAIKVTLAELMQEVLGKGTVLQFSENWGDPHNAPIYHQQPSLVEGLKVASSVPWSVQEEVSSRTIPLTGLDGLGIQTPYEEESNTGTGGFSFLDLV